MKLSTFKRIIAEDFDKASQALVSKLAYPINILFDQFSTALSNNLSFADNLYVQVKDISIKLDGDGNFIGEVQFKSTLRTKSTGIFCTQVTNTLAPSMKLSGAPFCSFTEESGLITITAITGLTANQAYKLRLVSIG